MLRRFFSWFVLCMVMSCVFVSHASAINLSINPSKFEETLDPGESKILNWEVTNKDESAILRFMIKDFVADGDTGVPRIYEESDLKTSIVSWIKGPQLEQFEEGEKKTIPFTITVPSNTEPGTYYGMILLEEKSSPGEGSIATVSRIGTLVFITVAGEIEEKIELESFDVDFETFKSGELPFAVKLKNSGNVHLKPQGKITIYDSNNTQITEIFTHPQGHQVDYLPFNTTQQIVLPKQERKYGTGWMYEDRFGEFKAQIELEYGKNNLQTLMSDMIGFEIREGFDLDFKTSKYFYAEFPIEFVVNLQNKGNSILEPKTRIEIYNWFNAKVADISVKIEGGELKGEAEQSSVITWDDNAFGPYKARLIATYGEGEYEKEYVDEVRFFVGPWYVLLAFGLGLVVIVGGMVWFVRRYLWMSKKVKEGN